MCVTIANGWLKEKMEEKNLPNARRKRVERIKKAILFLVIFFLLVPMIVCFILLLKIRGLQTRVEELERLMQLKSEAVAQEESVPFAEEESTTANTQANEKQSGEKEDNGEQNLVGRKVYLTFDDGPSVYTNDILDILKEYDVKATFFVVGKEDEDSLQAYRRIVEEGHTLAIHSYSHKYSEIYQSIDSYEEDLERLSTLLYNTTGVQCKYVRFPGGSSNKVSHVDMEDVIHYVHDQGMEYFDWNISASDAVNYALSADSIVNNVTSSIEKYDTAVILMHDGGNRKSTVEALPTIIENLQAMDDVYLLPIDDTTELVQHLE